MPIKAELETSLQSRLSLEHSLLLEHNLS